VESAFIRHTITLLLTLTLLLRSYAYLDPPFAMSTVPFSPDTPLSTSYLVELANSHVFDEISNDEDAVNLYILREGKVLDGTTRKTLSFVIYQTGKLDPQNGFRLCLVHRGFKIGEEKSGEVNVALDKACEPITQSTTKFVRLRTPPPLRELLA
jgi:hypothetical protein